MHWQFRRKPEPLVEVRVAEDDNDTVSLLSAYLQATENQSRPDALVLDFWQHGHWSQRQSRNRPGLRDDGQIAEEYVADDLLIPLSDERGPDIAAVPEGVYQPGLGVLAKGETVDVPDGPMVSTGFWPNQEAHDATLRPSLSPLTLLPQFTMPETIDQMIVHHPHGLHES